MWRRRREFPLSFGVQSVHKVCVQHTQRPHSYYKRTQTDATREIMIRKQILKARVCSLGGNNHIAHFCEWDFFEQ